MFYYDKLVPTIGTIVVASVSLDVENENCIYVTLPEYNNSRGIIYKRELPKRVKLQKKLIAEMKQAGHVVCTILSTPKLTNNSTLELVELSIKGVDQKYHHDI